MAFIIWLLQFKQSFYYLYNNLQHKEIKEHAHQTVPH